MSFKTEQDFYLDIAFDFLPSRVKSSVSQVIKKSLISLCFQRVRLLGQFANPNICAIHNVTDFGSLVRADSELLNKTIIDGGVASQ